MRLQMSAADLLQILEYRGRAFYGFLDI